MPRKKVIFIGYWCNSFQNVIFKQKISLNIEKFSHFLPAAKVPKWIAENKRKKEREPSFYPHLSYCKFRSLFMIFQF